MQPVTWNKESWHFRLASVYGNLDKRIMTDTNICEYTRHCLKGALIVLLCIIAGSLIGIPVVDLGAWAVVSFKLGHLLDLGPAALGATIVIVIIAAIIVFVLMGERFIEWRSKRRYKAVMEARQHAPVPPSFLVTSFKSWKENTCFKINFK